MTRKVYSSAVESSQSHYWSNKKEGLEEVATTFYRKAIFLSDPRLCHSLIYIEEFSDKLLEGKCGTGWGK